MRFKRQMARGVDPAVGEVRANFRLEVEAKRAWTLTGSKGSRIQFQKTVISKGLGCLCQVPVEVTRALGFTSQS